MTKITRTHSAWCNGKGDSMNTRMKALLATAALMLMLMAWHPAAHAEMSLYYIHNDHLGTPQVVTNEDQNVVWQADYQPFGEVDVTVNTLDQEARFPGQYTDDATGLHYNYFRDYDPSIGRYVTSDPIGLGGGLNTFGYVYQNPLSYIDPNGLDVTIIINRTGSTSVSVSGTIDVSSDVVSDTFSGHSLEELNPPNSNLPVPPNTYDAFVRTDRTPNRIQLRNVPNATYVQIHNGNDINDIEGCFAVGTTASKDFVGNSKSAMNKINDIIRKDGTGNIVVIVQGTP